MADSTLYRTNKVKEVKSWVHVVGFESTNDTCLFTTKKLNSQGLPTYININYGCQGWNNVTEIKYTYNENYQMVGMETIRNDELLNTVSLEVDSLGRVTRETNTVYDPFEVVVGHNTYFGDGVLADSMHTLTVVKGDTNYTRTVYTYLNGKLKKSQMVDIVNNKPINHLTNKYDSKGRLIREEFIYFLGYDNDNITKLEYNWKDQVVKTHSELDKIAAHFYYNNIGLPVLTHYFNKFESLEREMWHKYLFYE